METRRGTRRTIKSAADTHKNNTNTTTIDDFNGRTDSAAPSRKNRSVRSDVATGDLSLRMVLARIDEEVIDYGIRAILFGDAHLLEEGLGTHNSLAVEFHQTEAGLVAKKMQPICHGDLTPAMPTARAVLQTKDQIRFVLKEKGDPSMALATMFFEPYSDRVLLRKDAGGSLVVVRIQGEGTEQRIWKLPSSDHYKLPVGMYRIHLPSTASVWIRVVERSPPQYGESSSGPDKTKQEAAGLKKGKRRADDLDDQSLSTMTMQRLRGHDQQDVAAAGLSAHLELLTLKDGGTIRIPRTGHETSYTITRIRDLAPRNTNHKIIHARIETPDDVTGQAVSVERVLKLCHWNDGSQVTELEACWQELRTHWVINNESDAVIKLFGCDARLTSLELEYLPDGDLGSVRMLDYANMTTLSRQTAREISRAMLSALSFIHSKDIAHNDVKPANILYDQSQNRAVLCDFGHSTTTYMTNNGGSPWYIPPESRYMEYYTDLNLLVGAQRDVYALGVTLLFLFGLTPLPERTIDGWTIAAAPTNYHEKAKMDRWLEIVYEAKEQLLPMIYDTHHVIDAILAYNPGERRMAWSLLPQLPETDIVDAFICAASKGLAPTDGVMEAGFSDHALRAGQIVNDAGNALNPDLNISPRSQVSDSQATSGAGASFTPDLGINININGCSQLADTQDSWEPPDPSNRLAASPRAQSLPRSPVDEILHDPPRLGVPRLTKWETVCPHLLNIAPVDWPVHGNPVLSPRELAENPTLPQCRPSACYQQVAVPAPPIPSSASAFDYPNTANGTNAATKPSRFPQRRSERLGKKARDPKSK